MITGPFRQEAAANRSQRQRLDHLLRVTAPHERIMLAGAGVVLVAFISWLVFGSVTRSVVLDGILIKQGPRHEVVVLEPGHLMEFQVAPGDDIAAGAPIARQTVPELEREISVIRGRVDLLTAEIDQAVQQGGPVRSLLDSAHVALLQLEAQRAARSQIISHSAGEVMALHANLGDYISAGTVIAQVRTGESRIPQAVLYITPDMAQRIEPGLAADVEITMPDGTIRRVQGEVDSLDVGPLPRWLVPLMHLPTGDGFRVDVKLRQLSELAVADGMPCRVRIVLGDSTPLEILTLRQS